MRTEVFDARRNILGECPTSYGEQNELITWVDLFGRKVRSRDIRSAQITEYDTHEDVGFAIPRKKGGHVLGTANGPVLRDRDGALHPLPNRSSADGKAAADSLRWNDAKVSPMGDLFLGTTRFDYAESGAALYQLSADGSTLRRLFGDVTISNGLAWTADASRMFYIDTPSQKVDLFDVEGSDITNRRTFIAFPTDMGQPDGMCIDANDNLWIAFWMGGAVRCFSGKNGALLDEIAFPAPRITSCAFGGENLDQLFVTSASIKTDLAEFPEAGMVFVVSPGVSGQKTEMFGA